MSDAELPQPIYPPGGTTGGVAGASPAGPGHPGYGSTPPAGGGGSGRSTDPRVLIGVAIAAVVLVAGVVFALTRGGDDPDTRVDGAAASTTEPSATTVDSSGPDTSAEEPGPAPADDVRNRAETVAAAQLDSASTDTVTCLADGYEANPTLLDTIEPMTAGVTFDDPGLADEYARILVACATTDELLLEFESLLAAEGVVDPAYTCIIDNLSYFGAPQWQDFISTVLQPAESSYAQQLFADLAYC